MPHLTVVNPISRFLHSNIASGPLPKGAIGVAMFVVQFPEISVFVGLVYTLNGIFGFARCYGIMATTTDHKFQMTMAFQFLCTIFLMIITQVSWAPGGAMAAAAPSIACLTFGAHVLPAFLDFKARTTPEVLPADYYGMGNGDALLTKKATEKDVENAVIQQEEAAEQDMKA